MGQTLANRFVLTEAEADFGDGIERWEAHDTRLDRTVTLVAYPPELADAAEDAALAARVARDSRLARVSSVRDGDRVLVVIDRPAGTLLRDVLRDRLLPVDIARAAVRGAAQALAEADLASPGALLDITVTRAGKVVVAGAGMGAVGAEPAEPGALLAQWLRAAVAREDDDASPLTEAELRLAGAADGGDAVPLADLLEAVEAAPADALRGLAARVYTFERLVPLALPAPPAEPAPEELAPDRYVADELEPGIVLGPGVVLEPGGVVVLDDGTEVPVEDLDLWEYDELLAEETAEVEQLPTLREALLEYLHRRFPESQGITQALERAHERAQAGPRINAAPWTIVALFGFMVAMGYLGYVWIAEPFVPDYDIGIVPDQVYPEFTYPAEVPTRSPTP